MSMEVVLRQKEEELVEIYEANLENARNLQRTLRQDILPGLVHELHLEDEGERRATSWLHDLQSIFRLLRRHKFTVSFALEDARDVLLWRLAVIPTEIPRSSTSFIRCLPTNVRDPFGRPIIVVKLCDLLGSLHDVRSALINYMELLRLHLYTLNNQQQESAQGRERPILQYIVLVDIDRIPMQSVQCVDLITWFIYELIPRFPGMLAAALILNYSWAHSGVWNIIKRLLPKSALARIFFPSQDELLGFLSAAAIPCDYGGSLPLLTELEDPLENFVVNREEGTPGMSNPPAQPAVSDASASSSQPIPRVPSISTYSHLNPYFGYPVSRQGAPTPKLRHGRQRKRDLLRTLAALWWSKWRNRFLLLLCVVVCVITYRLRRTPRMLRWSQGMSGLLRLPARI
ncbi:CRAL/TRIO domain-containing protein [Dichomitus squalens]|uniref:CRAL/TRIO domain-containing protein n=1 Tax=Dichomitus squalens TaxID=114155 RepID=A0A4Q9P1L8_9APHY|nr:CRAL/TRIO domain-containing protein [Dichomitus squalens]TBU64439.1 CRAL/TRIO domain-containing protein [Dichomitus squalens]